MDKMTYEERVNKNIAEMAQVTDLDHFNDDDIVEVMTAAARIAVAKMAEAFRESYYILVRTDENIEEYDTERIDAALIEYGLIPGKTETI